MHSGISVVLKAEQLGSLFGFPITNSLLMAWCVAVFLAVFAYFFGKSLTLIPGKLQTGIEWMVEGVLAYITDILGSEALALKFFPFLASIFIFIFAVNEIAFLPGIGSIGLWHSSELIPLFHTSTADLNFTIALAVIAFITIEVAGIVTLGFFKYAGKYVNLSSPAGFAVGIIEFVSNLGRLISFSFRLFGNIFAGEVMILVASYFVPYLLPAPLMIFEMFIGLVQAIVFSMLMLFFIKLAIVEPHEAH